MLRTIDAVGGIVPRRPPLWGALMGCAGVVALGLGFAPEAAAGQPTITDAALWETLTDQEG